MHYMVLSNVVVDLLAAYGEHADMVLDIWDHTAQYGGPVLGLLPCAHRGVKGIVGGPQIVLKKIIDH
jgi:hypothetical protein